VADAPLWLATADEPELPVEAELEPELPVVLAAPVCPLMSELVLAAGAEVVLPMLPVLAAGAELVLPMLPELALLSMLEELDAPIAELSCGVVVVVPVLLEFGELVVVEFGLAEVEPAAPEVLLPGAPTSPAAVPFGLEVVLLGVAVGGAVAAAPEPVVLSPLGALGSVIVVPDVLPAAAPLGELLWLALGAEVAPVEVA